MKKVIISAVIILCIAIAGYQYATRPTTAPSGAVAPVPVSGAPVEGQVSYVFEQGETTASFTLGELLSGQPVTVVGTTGMITGGFTIDPAKPASIALLPVSINARTFVTDNASRDNATRRFILKTEDPANEFIVFTPSAVTGIPSTLTAGAAFPVTVTGNLAIAGVVKPATFQGTLTLITSDEFSGSLTGTVKRSEYGLQIPNIPKVANVDDEVRLSFSFDAVAVQ